MTIVWEGSCTCELYYLFPTTLEPELQHLGYFLLQDVENMIRISCLAYRPATTARKRVVSEREGMRAVSE